MTDRPFATKESALQALGTMFRIRIFEEAVEDLYGRGMMHGTMHLSIGQEAVPTGACLALRHDDQITSTHRGHGHCIAKGADIDRMMAELLARDNGYSRGRGGSMHIADFATGNLGANGIVAGGVPIAAGAALADQMRGNDRVTLCFHGDGAIGEGAWHEGLTLASMWSLPVIYLCENNLYGMSKPSREAFKIERLSEKAAGYGIPGVTVDGNNVEEVFDAVSTAVERARSGKGPTFIEALTYRWRGHSKSDTNRYRTKEEIAEWRERDPIAAFTSYIFEENLASKEEVDEVRTSVRDEIRQVVTFGMQGPEPDPKELLRAVARRCIRPSGGEVTCGK